MARWLRIGVPVVVLLASFWIPAYSVGRAIVCAESSRHCTSLPVLEILATVFTAPLRLVPKSHLNHLFNTHVYALPVALAVNAILWALAAAVACALTTRPSGRA
jgi:hypothetical protein